jgi:hypothetical protein
MNSKKTAVNPLKSDIVTGAFSSLFFIAKLLLLTIFILCGILKFEQIRLM